MIPALIPLIGTIFDKIFPDEKSANAAKFELLKLEADGAFKQLEVNKTEAANSSIFVAGWRPAIGWICAAIFAYTFLLQPVLLFALSFVNYEIPELPALDTSEVMTVLLGMLGLGGLRTIEKVKGVHSK